MSLKRAIANAAKSNIRLTLPPRWQAIASLSSTFSTSATSASTAPAAPRPKGRNQLSKSELKLLAEELAQLSARAAQSEGDPTRLRALARQIAIDERRASRPPQAISPALISPSVSRCRVVLGPHCPDALAWLTTHCALDNIASGDLAKEGSVTLVQAQWADEGGTKQLFISGTHHWLTIKRNLSKRGLSRRHIRACFPDRSLAGGPSGWSDYQEIKLSTPAEVDALVGSVAQHNSQTRALPATADKASRPLKFLPLRREFWLDMLRDYPEAHEAVKLDLTSTGMLRGVFAEDGVLRLWEAKVNGYKIRLVDSSFLALFRAKLATLGVPKEIRHQLNLSEVPSQAYQDLTFMEFNRAKPLMDYLRGSQSENARAGNLKRAPVEDAIENEDADWGSEEEVR